MHFNIYDVFYPQYSHQHVSAAIPVIFRVTVLLQEYSCGYLCHHHSIIISPYPANLENMVGSYQC